MRQSDKNQNHIVDDSGHNFDEAVINILNDIAHEPTTDLRQPAAKNQNDWETSTEQIDSFFDLPENTSEDL